MIKVNYTELDGPAGPTCRLEASGHAGYAPAGQDIVCAGASTLMQTLCALLAGEEGTRSGVWDEPDGPRLAVTAAAPQKPWVEGAFEFAKAGFALLAERYPDNVRFADLSGRGEQSMVDLQLFASEGGDAAAPSALATKGLVPFSTAAFMVCGLNIGTCITAVLASVTGCRNSKRIATFHVLFNLVGTIFFLIICSATPLLSWIAQFSGTPAHQVANFHTVFNIVTTVIMLPFDAVFMKLIYKLLPIKGEMLAEGSLIEE